MKTWRIGGAKNGVSVETEAESAMKNGDIFWIQI
jgi:hypothetical protein